MCFAGTIVGVLLALCEVGKYLFSDNLATFFNYCVNCPNFPSEQYSTGTNRNDKVTGCDKQIVGSDTITAVLLITANMILWGPVKKELEQTKFYKFICCIKTGDAWTAEAPLSSDEVAPLGKIAGSTDAFKSSQTNS